MNVNIAVHDFVATGETSSSRTAERLERGRDLVIACSSGDRWVTPRFPIDPSVFTLRHDRLYQYCFAPPFLATGKGSTSIPDWGQPSLAGDPDNSWLKDLQEFDSADFQTSLMHPKIREVRPSRLGKRVHGDISDERAKRPRLIESSRIQDLMPQPWFISFPPGKYRPVDTSKIPPYTKASPSPFAPYDAAAVNQLLHSKYRRTAWLIPVRGNLPWDGASTAVVLEALEVASRSPSPCLHAPAAQPHAIMWTPDSLQHFWAFLGTIQQAKHLGPLSLSFRAALADSKKDSISEPVWESNHPYYYSPSSKYTATPLDDFATDICKARLEEIDYIRIFHDVTYSLSLRNILDAYRYEPVNGEVLGRSGANDCKIRILKGARLALVDECFKAAFLM